MHPPTHVKDRLIVALDVETLADAERHGRPPRGAGHPLQDRLAALHRRRPRRGRGHPEAGRRGLPRPQVPRHPQHGGGRRARGDPHGRADVQRPRLRRARHDGGGGRGGRHRGPGAGRAPADRPRGHRAHEPRPGRARPRAGRGRLGGGPRAPPGRARGRGGPGRLRGVAQRDRRAPDQPRAGLGDRDPGRAAGGQRAGRPVPHRHARGGRLAPARTTW